MKKLFLTALVFAGVQLQAIAQEAETTTETEEQKEKRNWYISAGAIGNDGYNINEKLAEAGMPELNDMAFEITIGHSTLYKKVLIDLEFGTAYNNDETSGERVRMISGTFKLRGHYVPVKNDKFFLSGGLDISYTLNNFDLYTRGNTIDMDDLDPSMHSGHISLFNEQMFIGPSIAFGALQNTDYPLRLNIGYEWSMLGGMWKSNFAAVEGSFKENGQGRFYAKATLYL